jgi:signal transduction histidine kinase
MPSLLDGAGAVRWIGVIQEIAEHNRDVKRASSAEEWTLVDAFAAALGHRINNSICAAWTATAAAQARRSLQPGRDPLDECLQTIGNSLQKCQEIVQDVLRLAHHESSPKEPHDLNGVVVSAIEAMRHYATLHKVVVHLDAAENLARPNINPLEIEQVLVNLLRDSVEAGAVLVTVRTRHQKGAVQVIIQDNGNGIARADLKQLFSPFFSVEGIEAIGLERAISQSPLSDRQGSVEIVSESGQGRMITIRLPVSEITP